MQARAKTRIPGMTQLLSKRPDMFAPGAWPGYFKKSQGAEVWDLDNNHYLDMSISGIGANILGYADPDVNRAVIKAVELGTSSSLNCPEEVQLADLLCEIHSWADMVRYTRAGGEAMAMAVRIARAYTQKDLVVFCGYHGWHDWYLAANLGDDDNLAQQCLPGLDPAGVPRGLKGTAIPFHYNQLDEFEAVVHTHADKIAAIVMEPLRSEYPHDGFLDTIRQTANRIGAVLVYDEISAGFRLTTGGAHLLLGVEPDLAVFSKAMGNGYPISAVIGRRPFMEAAQGTFISSTNWTDRVGPVAAIATIEKHRRLNVAAHLEKIGSLVQQGWGEIAAECGLDISVAGIKPASYFIFNYDNALALKALFIRLMLKQGILASNLLYVMYAHKRPHVDQYLTSVRQVFGEIRRAMDAGKVETLIDNQPASSGFKRLA